MKWYEVALSTLYLDLWWHNVVPLAWPWDGCGPVFWMIDHFLPF